jgi:hypothetical protein
MEADTNDAATLCTIAIQTIRDFDTRALFTDAVEETKDDDSNEENVAPDSAQALLEWVPAFLWAVAHKKVAGCTFQLADSATVETWCTTVRNNCFGPIVDPRAPPLPRNQPTNLHSDNLDLRLGALASSLERMAQLQEERTKTEQSDKDTKAFKKLEPFTQAMLLFASEPVTVTDDEDTFTMGPRTQPIDSYTQLLSLGNVAQAKLHLDVTLQTQHKCPVSLPLATVNVILNGRLTWSDHTNPEAFSIFACFKPGASAMGTSSDEFLALQLKSAEGKGLSDVDVARSTKVELRAPTDVHELGEFIGAFALVLAFIFGPNATVHKAVHGWLAHIQAHELLYTQQLHADRAFGCKILALIDRAIQLYFRECMHTDRQVGAARFLMFDRYQNEIIMNTFTYTALPSAIAKLLAKPAPATQSSLSPAPVPSRLPSSGPMAYNFDPYPEFQLAIDQVAILQNMVNTAPLWMGPQGQCRVCPRFQSGGACTADCPRAATHRSPTDQEIGPYIAWIRNRGRTSAAGGGGGGGKSKSNQSTGEKRQRPSSPTPPAPKQDGKKKVKFASNTKSTESDF